MWNNLDLKSPTDDLSEYSPQDEYLIEELKHLVTILSTAANTLTSEEPLWTELQVLKDIQMKYKIILRCDKCLIFLHRISHCTKKMVLLNLSKSYLNLAERFLVNLQSTSYTWHLPSRQQLEYILIRTLTASKLVCQGIQYSREAFCFLILKLKVGHLILDLVMAASLVARLNVLLRGTLEQLCSMYQLVLSWRYKLKVGTHQWSKKLDFPVDLKEWLKSSESGCFEPISTESIDMLSHHLTSNNEDSDSDSIVVINEIEERNNSEGQNITKMVYADYGEVISRKEYKEHQLTAMAKCLFHKIMLVKSFKELENIWNHIQDLPKNDWPKPLTVKGMQIINKLILDIKKSIPEKRYNKVFKNLPKSLRYPISVICKCLGFTINDIKAWKHKESASMTPETSTDLELVSVEEVLFNGNIKLVPVKTLKELKQLYSKLSQILEFTKETKKQRKLKKIFKRHREEIKLLRQNGEKVAARKLIFCTSKLLLTNYKRSYL